MKINKQNNIYTIVYIILLASIVGTGLAFASMALRSKQQANADADKMAQILQSVRMAPQKADVIATFNSVITRRFVVDAAGDSIAPDAFEVNVAAQTKKPVDQRLLPVYVATIAGGDKYIVPVHGSGLWGPIWGYVAFDSDGSTIYGAYFAHEGETPGLGAEIEKPAFRNQFDGKRVFKNNTFLPVNVLKTGTKPQAGEDYVDAVSGGTITSKGVAAMLDDGLKPYEAFLRKVATNNQQ